MAPTTSKPHLKPAAREKLITSLMSKPCRNFTSVDIALWRRLGDEHQRSTRPNKHTDTAAWNAHFERALAFKYRPHLEGLPRPRISPAADPELAEQLLGTTESVVELNMTITPLSKELMDKEGKLILRAIDCLVDRGFEKVWAGMGKAKRAELLLEGLYRGAYMCPRENSREVCPEMTIAGLASDGQFGLISMLKAVIAHDPTGNGRCTTVYLFKHPILRTLLRNIYIVLTLIGVLETWMGYPRAPVQRVYDTGPVKSDEQRQKTRIIKDQLKRGDFYIDRSQNKEEKAQYKAGIYRNGCRGCHKPHPRSELKRCARCKDVWYCSSECQTRDWKEHKRTCNLQQFNLEAVAPTPQEPNAFIGCPPADPGFVRSPALWNQIEYLSKDDSQRSDYHYDTKPGYTASFSLDGGPKEYRISFLVARSRAMRTGSRAAVAHMLAILSMPAVKEPCGLSAGVLDTLRGQMAVEYRVTPFADWDDVWRAAGGVPQVTTAEYKEEEGFLAQRLMKHEKLMKSGEAKLRFSPYYEE
ncbi:SET domain-containing protein [Mycena kentingensis (nom. inval.)]|nr:SET domain-containing protein [Mycena kentingensis (nom. inval.)]